MGAITDLLKSERGLFALALVIAATVLTALGTMTIDAWRDFTLYIFGIYVTGKTVTGAVGLFKATPAVANTAAAPVVVPEPEAQP